MSARREGEQWLFSFSDNGIGIPAEYAERIFVIFQRLHDRAAYPGTGIGLAMCRKIIEYHGGRIWLDTTVTSGARFCFTLPARPGMLMPMTEHGECQAVHVLLVEDDPGDVLMTREAFEHHKLRNVLHVVTDGEQALQFLRRTGSYADAPRPGLILLDLNLPRLDGLEVLAELKADPVLKVIPVVILTTSQAQQDVLRSYALHANAYVSKPVDFETFMEVIRQIDNFFVTVVKLAP